MAGNALIVKRAQSLQFRDLIFSARSSDAKLIGRDMAGSWFPS
jgi:hypothetical protein